MPFFQKNKIILLLFLFVNLITAQKYHSKNYTSAEDLPNNTIRSLLIDSKNILWIGTDNGLVKKENNVFTSYFEEDGLSQNNIWALAEDSNQHIWAGSYGGGISIYDGFQFKNITQQKGLVHNNVIKLFPFQNYMCVGTYDGLSFIDIKTHQVFSSKPKTKKPFKISGFFTYKNELYCTTVWTGVYKIVLEKKQLKVILVNKNQNSAGIFIENNHIYSSNIGFFTHNSIESFISNNSTPTSKLGHSILWEYTKDHQNSVFVAAGGLYTNDGGVYEIVENQLISRNQDFDINSKNSLSIAFDKKFNKLYVGTFKSGLYEVELNDAIKFISIPNTSVLGFSKIDTTSAYLLKDALILENQQQKKRIPLEQFKKWQQNFLSITKRPLPKHEDFFYEIDYTAKASDIKLYDIKSHQNKFWINTTAGLFVISNLGELFQYLPLHTEEFNFTSDGKLIETNPYHGLRVYDNLTELKYTYYPEEDPKTPTMVVNSFKKGTKTYLLSVFSGLYTWNNNEFTSYLENNSWNENKLRHITALDNNMAISTEFGDVYIVNDEKSFKALEKIPRAKIQGNTISFLNQFKGHLLIGTEKGLTIYKNNRFIFINQEQGLNQPFLSSIVRNNHLLIGSENGYYTINIESFILSKSLLNSIALTAFKINNKTFTLAEGNQDKKVNLAYDQNSLILNYSTNSHPYPNKLRYQYRLNKQEEWSQFSTKPEIILPFLKPNIYDIEVNVLDLSTGLNYQQRLILIDILPPFWKTWWFILLLFLTVVLIIYGVYRFHIAQHTAFEIQKSKIQKRVEETKMEALLAQMNPHFIFNAMNSIQGYIMDSDIPNATYFLSEFSSLIRKNLDHCTKPTILLIEELEYIQSYIQLENIRFNNLVNIQYTIDPKLNLYDIEIPSMLLQPFIENVFVHAFPPSITEPKLSISFDLIDENTLKCSIIDNGIGISSTSNKLHQSKGISLIKERLILLDYEVDKVLSISSRKNYGTTITLTLQIER